MVNMKYKKAIQVPKKVTQGIFNLPCVSAVRKTIDGSIIYDLDEYVDKDCNLHEVFDADNDYIYHAFPGMWICESEDGDWYVMTDKEYQTLSERG